MRYCEKCGKELLDEAVVCTGCGCMVADKKPPVKTGKKKTKIKKLWIVLGAVGLCLALAAAVLFLPRDLKLDDIKETNIITAFIRYGLPERIDSDEDGTYLKYGEKIDFYGITPYGVLIYPETDEVVFFFHSEDAEEVYYKIEDRCDLESDLLGMYHKFSYENLNITVPAYDGYYVGIEID